MRKFALAFFVLSVGVASGQDKDSTVTALKEQVSELKGALDGVNETLQTIVPALDALRKIKITGYIQSQFQVADGDGVGSFAGGNFPTGVHSRFLVRRGRVKVNYDNDLTQYVLQIDVTQNGIGIKDAYASVKEPWLKTFGLTAGIFERPFGFEISYSSSNREAPERTRMYQTLFPGERELGAKIEITPPETSPYQWFNLKAGLFNGVLNTANENDNYKDFIGRAGVSLPFSEANLALDAGVSIYSGKVRNTSKFLNTMDTGSGNFSVDSTASNSGSYFDRSYLGVDLQLYYDLPVLGGLSLRGEYISGKQPGTSTSNSFYNPGTTVTPLYLRNFNGYYINFIQNIGLSNQFVVKYDVFDPNSDVDGGQLGAAGKNLTLGDIKYSTLGIGWIYHWDANVKFTFYYDMVANESVNAAATGTLAPFKEDVKDNVFTVRMQYKF